MGINQIYKKSELDNGLKVVSYKMLQRQTASIGVWIGVGGRYENKSNKGISHFLEHMVFKGSKRYSNRKIKESIEGVGGSLNAFTSEEFTCYLAKVPARYLYSTLDVLSDMAVNPLFKKEDFDREKTVIIEEIKMYKDLPQHYVQELLDELLWPGHPLGMNIAGTIESVGSMGRESLFGFKNRFYIPSNTVVACCGDIDHQEFVNRVKNIYPKSGSKYNIGFKKVSAGQNKSRINLYTKNTEQTHFSLGMHGLKRNHPDRYALALLNIILGANMSSRLFHQVREKRGLAYSIGTHIKRFYDCGAFLVHAGVDNRKAAQAIKVVLSELEKIRRYPVTNKEFNCAKEYLIGQLLIALEDTLDHMLWIGEQTKAMNRIYTLDKILKDIKKITKDDLLRLSNTIFKEGKINLALIGPNADKDRGTIEGLLS